MWGLTVVEFIAIKRNLENISDTWSDLWAMLYLSQLSRTASRAKFEM